MTGCGASQRSISAGHASANINEMRDSIVHASFYAENRRKLTATLPAGSLMLLFAGSYIRKTADENHMFYANRNFAYLTGIDQVSSVLVAFVTDSGVEETLFLLPKNPRWERWNGTLIGFDAASEASGIAAVRPLQELNAELDTYLTRRGATQLWVDIDCLNRDPNRQDFDSPAHLCARDITGRFPHVQVCNLLPRLKRQRAIKAPCEIEAMRQAEVLTGKGITAMMQAARPGMYEYELKAIYEGELMRHGALPGFPSIISTGSNNFCIHYYGYHGQVADGDMILNDVGARYDFLGTDVSRGWPANGKFSEKQRILYECAYETSQHMFSILKPGVPHSFVDKTIKAFNFERLRDRGVCQSFEDVGTYMWHGGAHHVGFDTHDVVDVVESDRLLEPGMVFCVDIGIYHEAWGVGFRLEDNCLITENGCENLSAGIPRSIQDIEAAMGR